MQSGLHQTYRETIKQVIPWLLVLHKELQVLEDLLLHWNTVVISDGVLTEEVKLHHVLLPVQFFMECCARTLLAETVSAVQTSRVYQSPLRLRYELTFCTSITEHTANQDTFCGPSYI